MPNAKPFFVSFSDPSNTGPNPPPGYTGPGPYPGPGHQPDPSKPNYTGPNPGPYPKVGGGPYPSVTQPVGGISYATFEEVQKAVQAYEPQAVAQSDGNIVAVGGTVIGKWVRAA
jgi:hypothetical protein